MVVSHSLLVIDSENYLVEAKLLSRSPSDLRSSPSRARTQKQKKKGPRVGWDQKLYEYKINIDVGD